MSMEEYERQQAAARAERIRDYERVSALVPAIAAALGATVEERKREDDQPGSLCFVPRWTLTVQHEGRAVPFTLSHGGFKKASRWSVCSANLMQGTRYVMPRDYGLPSFPDATFADTTAPEVLARGIARRFLTEYAPRYLAVVDAISERTDAAARRLRMARDMAAQIGPLAQLRGDDGSPTLYLYSDKGVHGQVEYFNTEDGTVSVRLSGVSAEAVVALLAASMRGK